jgi:hypothetical protein
MVHEFKSQAGRVFTAEKRGEKYIINGCAVANKNYMYFEIKGVEAEKLCANIGAASAAKNTNLKIMLERAEYSRLMAAFSAEQEQCLSSLPTQYRLEDVFVNADGDMVPVGKKITEYKVDGYNNEHVIIVREFKNNELDQEITEENYNEIISSVYAARESRKRAQEIADAEKKSGYEITYHGDYEMWNGVRME